MSDSLPISELTRSPSAKFEQMGDKYVGRILSAKRQQGTDMATGQPSVWANGDPKLLTVVTIQPDQGDALTLWARGGNFTPRRGTGMSMEAAIVKAVVDAGASAIDAGGRLAVQWTGEADGKAGFQPAKLYTAQYEPPSKDGESIPVDLFS